MPHSVGTGPIDRDGDPGAVSENSEHEPDGPVDLSCLHGVKATGEVAQPAGVDRAHAAIMAWAVWLRARMCGFSRLVSSVGYLAGPAVVGEGLADPPANPHVRVVVAGLQGLEHSRDPGRGRAVGDGVDHVAADPWIGIPGQLEQPRPHPVVVGPDVAGAQVPARELASPALLAPGQLQQSVDSIPGCAPLAGRQADPYLLSDLAPPSHRPDDSAGRLPGPRIIPPAGAAFGPLTSPGHPKWPGRLGQPR
jgi:hypothetical protein